VKLTVDCLLDHQMLALHSGSALACLLAMGQIKTLDQALEAVVCDQYDVPFVGDYPIAAIAVAADGLEVGEAYWLRADPVHLRLQRDCFSLDETVPLPLEPELAEEMLASLNQHFRQNAHSGSEPEVAFLIGLSGAWYLRCLQKPIMTTSLPSIVAGKNIHQFLPQGEDRSKWVGLLNEVQMIWHEHPANLARGAKGLEAANSIWLSGGGCFPKFIGPPRAEWLMANSAFYQGLALWSNTPYESLPTHLDAALNKPMVRIQLASSATLDLLWFKPILAALKAKKITQLTINLGCYDQSLSINIKPIDRYKFWRKPKPVQYYFP